MLRFIVSYSDYIKSGLILISCVLFFAALRLYVADAIADRYKAVKKEMLARLSDAMHRTKRKNAFSYEHQQMRLDALGVTYYSKGRMTPLVYLGSKMAGLTAGLFIGFMFSPAAGIVLAAACYIFPDYYAKERNKRDNGKMLKSIMNVYDVILLQTNSGVYITRILIDAYRVASHPRLKAALLTLTGDIVASNELTVSMEVFGRKFDNESIKNLVVIVRQLAETGSSENMLLDIKKHLTTLQESYNKYEQDRTNRMGNMCLMAIFVCLMGILAFACVASLADSAILFAF